ncbi:MAG: hypothetical protein IKQ31_03235 [Clostridia bacterium]|nr:hypothetical protein [Clostridia bacterium]
MEFNDEQFPNETSICNMQKSYANDVFISKNNSEILDILNSINWQEDTLLLKDLASKAPNESIRNYIMGLVGLNEADQKELYDLFKLDIPRKNPTLNSYINQNYNSVFKAFVKSETNVLNSIIELLVISSSAQTSLTQMLSRRLEALATLSQFQTNGFFI